MSFEVASAFSVVLSYWTPEVFRSMNVWWQYVRNLRRDTLFRLHLGNRVRPADIGEIGSVPVTTTTYWGADMRDRAGERLLTVLAFPVLLDGWARWDSDVRAYNTCLSRHPQDAVVCEGPRQAYELEPSIVRARSVDDSYGPNGR